MSMMRSPVLWTKHEIARALQRNRTSIAKRYRGD
jgi:hypothetical protein